MPRRDSAFIHVEILLLAQQAGATITEVTIEHYPPDGGAGMRAECPRCDASTYPVGKVMVGVAMAQIATVSLCQMVLTVEM